MIVKAIGAVARAQGMTDEAENAGLPREYLDPALSGSATVELATVLKLLSTLGISLFAQTRAA